MLFTGLHKIRDSRASCSKEWPISKVYIHLWSETAPCWYFCILKIDQQFFQAPEAHFNKNVSILYQTPVINIRWCSLSRTLEKIIMCSSYMDIWWVVSNVNTTHYLSYIPVCTDCTDCSLDLYLHCFKNRSSVKFVWNYNQYRGEHFMRTILQQLNPYNFVV